MIAIYLKFLARYTENTMKIEAQQIGKKYIKDWVFNKLDYSFLSGEQYAIIGPNGSGKSTLLQVLAGFVPCTTGEIRYTHSSKMVTEEQLYKNISYASPYLENIEEFTLNELIDFHFKFKKLQFLSSKEELISFMYLEKSANKPIKFFSSGMKQRTKLGLAFFSQSSLLILDEPTSNLDKTGIAWYLNLIEKYTANRTLLIGSNQENEYDFCKHTLSITDYQ
jgi:ABC-type multidrug transport system ATPase subunit